MDECHYRIPFDFVSVLDETRGLEDVADAIECNMFTIMKNHVNGYFTDNAYEGVQGLEFDYEIPLSLIEKSGGISHINHPTDLLQSWKRPECAKVPENIEFFADLLRKYKSCIYNYANTEVTGES